MLIVGISDYKLSLSNFWWDPCVELERELSMYWQNIGILLTDSVWLSVDCEQECCFKYF